MAHQAAMFRITRPHWGAEKRGQRGQREQRGQVTTRAGTVASATVAESGLQPRTRSGAVPTNPLRPTPYALYRQYSSS